MSLSYEERKKTILELLEENGKVVVRKVEKLLNVSGETVRRDLERLEKEGFLKKVYGGAVKNRVTFELPFDQKTMLNAKEKSAICKKAAELVEDSDVIFIGHGTTVLELVRFLNNKKNVTIITPSLPVLLLANEHFEGKIIFLGGEFERDQKFTSGPLEEMALRHLKANKAFFSAGGISIEDGISDYDLSGARSSRTMMERSNEVIVLADSAKFNLTTLANIGKLSEVSIIITDKNCSDQMKMKLLEQNVELIVSDEME
ncbi:DeoR/GlpR family DNA-binding transcription regulator [Psychrobacillus soli]|uniref:DeoR/GlpR transcriptional regulator n=1 Tax=Psychrobacillus soli TaxID=1543965 RepID=A0A544SU27_9BACI|nr:DeoR/GlpR family DNA-binding transcription regulator [Psychrobacillus soli]TQR08730.1 DeoR/GlpR transcriptional regulator [Psychrobacillus soli]